jgi:hypothetical protein
LIVSSYNRRTNLLVVVFKNVDCFALLDIPKTYRVVVTGTDQNVTFLNEENPVNPSCSDIRSMSDERLKYFSCTQVPNARTTTCTRSRCDAITIRLKSDGRRPAAVEVSGDTLNDGA